MKKKANHITPYTTYIADNDLNFSFSGELSETAAVFPWFNTQFANPLNYAKLRDKPISKMSNEEFFYVADLLFSAREVIEE
jgi:hypothetical protein